MKKHRHRSQDGKGIEEAQSRCPDNCWGETGLAWLEVLEYEIGLNEGAGAGTRDTDGDRRNRN